jgi:hypothetical protein
LEEHVAVASTEANEAAEANSRQKKAAPRPILRCHLALSGR